MKIRHLGMATAVVFLAGISFVAVAQQHRPQGRRGAGGEWWNSPQAIEALQLDDQTRGIIQEEVHSTRLQLITLKGDVQRAELELQRLLHTEPMPSTSEIEAQVDPRARRANLLLRGIDLYQTADRVLQVAGCRIKIRGETLPCGRMDEAAPGLQAALAPEWRGGAYGVVLEGGTVRSVGGAD